MVKFGRALYINIYKLREQSIAGPRNRLSQYLHMLLQRERPPCLWTLRDLGIVDAQQ
jgi:hypothetical protein